MPTAYQSLPIENLAVIQESLSKSAANIAKVITLMQQYEMKHARISWSDTHLAWVSKITGASSHAVSMVEEQLIAHRTKTPSVYDLAVEASSKRISRRKLQEKKKPAENPESPPKKRGRPRKNR